MNAEGSKEVRQASPFPHPSSLISHPALLQGRVATLRKEPTAPEEFTAPDGARLGYIAWRPHAVRRTSTSIIREASAQIALVYLHGIESHAGWFALAGEGLSEAGYDVYCLDRRGSGLNRENRGFRSGDVDSWTTLAEDVHEFAAPLRDRYDAVYLVGLSWGGKLAVGCSLRHPDDFAGLILITPGLKTLVDLPVRTKLKVLLARRFAPTRKFPIPIEPEMFTETPEFLEFVRDDPRRLHEVTSRFLIESFRLERFIDRNISRLTTPVLLFLAGRERIINNAAVESLLRRSAGADLTIHRYDDQTHSIQFDAPERLAADVVAWIDDRRDGGKRDGETRAGE